MPTIDELEPAAAAADDDYLPVSQAGVMRRVTRSELLAGYQSALALAPGGLLGRGSAGLGGPEAITVGANLQLRDGVLSAPSPFSVRGLPASAVVSPADTVAVARGGQDVAVPVGTLLARLSSVPGLDLSTQGVRVGSGPVRSLADWVGDAVAVEAFGAVGDGVTDDSAAIDRALASGQPVRFGAKTYVVNGQWTVTRPAVLLGVPGATVLRRMRQAGGAWISIRGASFGAMGIVFDAGSLPGDSWGVLVEDACRRTLFEHCVFRGATGATLGSGLTIGARDGSSGSPSRHVVRNCEAHGNSVHGFWLQAVAGGNVEGCSAHENGSYGICLDFNDATFQHKVRHGRVSGCEAWGNRRGISVGNYNETNLEPPRWGNANPDAIGVLVTGNRCHGNSEYGIAVAGLGLQVSDNLLEGNASGLLINAMVVVANGNMILGPGQYGIDSGGSVECELLDNLVQGFAVGINPGGSRAVRVAGNALLGNAWGVTVYGVETDGRGANFGIACNGVIIERNRIELKDGSGGGVFLIDGPQGVVVAGNAFSGGVGSSSSQAFWAHTDQFAVRNNTWNNQARLIANPVGTGSTQQIQFPDMLDGVMVTSVPGGQAVGSIVGQHQAALVGQVAFIKVVNGGTGYTSATVSIAGGGSGARAIAYIRDGVVVGIAVTASGSGYGSTSATVAIAGNGQGAQATAFVGLGVPDGRRLQVHCNGPVRFKRVGSTPFQDNWTGVDIMVPSASIVEWAGAWGGWHAVSFPLADYLVPMGDGSFSVRSVTGDIVMRPGGQGRVRIGSDAEPAGFASLLGRGSPEGVVSAPAGSDYRNLDGGAGATLWVKRTGSAATGWVAVI